METTLQTTAVSENTAGAAPVSRWQKAAGVLIVIASVFNFIALPIVYVLNIVAFAILVFRSAGHQMRMMTSVVLVSFFILLIGSCLELFVMFYQYMEGFGANDDIYGYMVSIIPSLAYLLQMYAVSVIARVEDSVSKENFVMIQLWLVSSLICCFLTVPLSQLGVPHIQSYPLNGIFAIMAAVSWNRIVRTRLFAGKGQDLRTVSYSPLNKFMGAPFICAAVAVLVLVVVITFLN